MANIPTKGYGIGKLIPTKGYGNLVTTIINWFHKAPKRVRKTLRKKVVQPWIYTGTLKRLVTAPLVKHGQFRIPLLAALLKSGALSILAGAPLIVKKELKLGVVTSLDNSDLIDLLNQL